MRHQYKTEVHWKKIVQSLIDFFVDIYAKFFININVSKQNSDPETILFVTLAQLGDALVESYVFPLIHERYPNAKIDVLTCEWCKPILENNPHVRNLIFFNHIRMNRLEISFWKKIQSHIKSSRSALKLIRLQNYDLSMEGGATHPNGNIICYLGRIKRRIGSGSGGFGALLTDEVLFPSKSDFHILEVVLEELRVIGINKKLEEIKPYFITSKEGNSQQHPFTDYFKSTYIIIHPESGRSIRTMSKEFWLEIVRNILNTTDCLAIVCGTSEKSSTLVNFLSSSLQETKGRIIDSVQKLSLDEFFLLSKYAKAAFTVESLAAHLCSINCDTISFFKNGSGAFFFPITNKSTTIIHNHLPSKKARIHTNLRNFYIKDIESKETHEIVDKFIRDLIS
jgi:heptosyltransferase-3